MGPCMLKFLLVEIHHQIVLLLDFIFVILMFFGNCCLLIIINVVIVKDHFIHGCKFILCRAYFSRHLHFLVRNDNVLVDLSALN